MSIPRNSWLILALICIFITIILFALEALAVAEFLDNTVRQQVTGRAFGLWLDLQQRFGTVGVADMGFGILAFFFYRRYATALEKEK